MAERRKSRPPAEDSCLAALDVSLAERFRADTHWPIFARLRREEPVHFCRESLHGPYWSITRYDDIVEIERNHRQFSSDANVIIGDVPPAFDCTRAFATSDPPVHTRERRAVTPALSPARMAALEPQIRQRIAALLDELPRGEPFDWVARVSVEITTQMVAALFDFPWAQRHRLTYWSEVLVTTPAEGALVSTWQQRDAVIGEYRDCLLEMWHARAKRPPGPDIVSALAHNPDTAAMAEDPMHLVGTASLIAGANEAARGALSGCIVAFNRFASEWEKLRATPALLGNAVAEIVRWQTPISHMRRTATEGVDFRGRRIGKGDRVVMWYCSGNRDEAWFEDANALRIDRPNARRHLAYGFGIHNCLGRHAAEMELRILLEEILRRFERIELVAEPKRIASNFSANYRQLLVRIPK